MADKETPIEYVNQQLAFHQAKVRELTKIARAMQLAQELDTLPPSSTVSVNLSWDNLIHSMDHPGNGVGPFKGREDPLLPTPKKPIPIQRGRFRVIR